MCILALGYLEQPTDGVRTNGVRVDSKQRNGNESTVMPQTQDSVSQFERSVVGRGISLKKVNVWEKEKRSFCFDS